MPISSAARRASSTSDTLQQPVSLSPPQSRIVTPTMSWPSRASSAAATDESTPPLIATMTLMAPRALTPTGPLAAAWRRIAHSTAARPVDVGLGGGVAEREPQRPGGQRRIEAHRSEHV